MPSIDFDFAPVLAVVAHKAKSLASDRSLDRGMMVLLKDILVIPPMRQYLALYVSRDLSADIQKNKEAQRPASLTYLYSKHYTRLSGTAEREAPDYIRLKTTYPLTADEMGKAQTVYSSSEVLTDVVAALQGGLSTYLQDMGEYAARYGYDMNYRVSDVIKKIKGVVENFTLIHDLVPALAYSFAEQGWESDGDFSEAGFTKALHSAFRKQFFKSVDYEDEALTECPFRSVIGHIFNTVLEYRDDGSVIALDEDRPGAFPYFMTQKIAFNQERTRRRVDLWLATLRVG